MNSGDCTASYVFERSGCDTGDPYTDSYSFDPETGTIGVDTDMSGRAQDHPEEKQCLKLIFNSGYWAPGQYEM